LTTTRMRCSTQLGRGSRDAWTLSYHGGAAPRGHDGRMTARARCRSGIAPLWPLHGQRRAAVRRDQHQRHRRQRWPVKKSVVKKPLMRHRHRTERDPRGVRGGEGGAPQGRTGERRCIASSEQRAPRRRDMCGPFFGPSPIVTLLLQGHSSRIKQVPPDGTS